MASVIKFVKLLLSSGYEVLNTCMLIEFSAHQ